MIVIDPDEIIGVARYLLRRSHEAQKLLRATDRPGTRQNAPLDAARPFEFLLDLQYAYVRLARQTFKTAFVQRALDRQVEILK